MGSKDKPVDRETVTLLSGLDREQDARVCWAAVRRRIDALQSEGQSVPEELVIAERQLMTELVAESQGR